jgi:glycosyltransferase 2 family protein
MLNPSFLSASAASATDQRRKHQYPLALVGKLILAGLLILWMVHSGRLDFGDVDKAVLRWPEMSVVAGLCYAGYFIGAFRWKLLLVQQGIRASMRDVFALSMIGALFNTITPGAVSGDVMKAYYVSVRYPAKKAQAVTTVLLDRVVGLTSLLVFSAIAGAGSFGTMTHNGKVAVLYWTVVVAALTGLALAATVVLMNDRIVKVAEALAQRFPLLKPLAQSFCAMAVFYNSPFTVAVSFLTSLVGQCVTYFAFYVIGLSIGVQSIPVAQLLFVIPLGLTAMALPIAPAGLGVGQVVFYALFSDLVPGAGSVGASMVTIYQVVYIFLSLTGIIFYLSETRTRKAVAVTNE